ncbi:MAG: GxxExxY protein [Anaerolineae bacterium CG03_land_8_20_14_0_80_58_20]|nr:MAG: GxxExxY protein [Anaerolineae bacterium CG1_02_58_13]PIV26130.1 MAG: GxxExxY protein [Anaerolineae bacterium CG03_land_8_20_14_0_80_58_20]
MLPRYAGKTKPFEGKHSELSQKIIKVFYDVHNELGYGFSEKVYQKAYAIALRQDGMKVDEQIPIKVYFRGQLVGEFFADMIINDLILLELKAAEAIIEEFEAQLLNYLKSTEIEVGYVMNFGKSASFKRKVFDNERKGSLRWTKK